MNTYDPVDLPPGEARCPGPDTAEIISADKRPAPEKLTKKSYQFLGDEDIHYDRYTSQEFFDREIEKMWSKVWQWVCRLEHIPEVGDNYVYDVGPYSILVVRHGEGPEDVKAYHNSCLHRGTQLKPSLSMGNSPKLRCPFHGWEWNLDGTVNEIPCRWDFPKVTDEAYGLPEVKVGFWGGFAFINMDPDCTPLVEYLEVLPEHFSGLWDLGDRYTVTHVEKTLPANWKAAQEAFIEAYHVLETHPQAADYVGDANAQYDVFGSNTSRFVQTVGYESPHRTDRLSEQALLESMGAAPAGTEVPEGATARSVIAKVTRAEFSSAWGVDLSEYSDSELMDSLEYHLFPNMFLFPGVRLPMIYRFRPNGADVDSSIFDVLFLRLKPVEGEPPEPPEPYRIDAETSYTVVPELAAGLGGVFDQDTFIMEMQRRGQRASIAKQGATLGNYQEVRIRRMHMTLDQYLDA